MSPRTHRRGGALAYGRGRKPALLTLPDELLSEIFEISLPHTPSHHLSAICRQLRSVALRTPRLWSTICFRVLNPELVPPTGAAWKYETLCLRRSRAVPLDIRIDWVRSSAQIERAIARRDASHWLARSDVLRVLALLWPHVRRIREFTLHCDLHFPFALLGQTFACQNAPKLEVLDLLLYAPRDDMAPPAVPVTIFGGGMDALRTVSVQGVALDWANMPLGCKSLRSLSLTHLPVGEEALAKTIAASPGLEELTLLATAPPATHTPDDEPHHLADTHALRSLTVDSAALRCIPLAGLRTLVLTRLTHIPPAIHFSAARIAYLTLHRTTAAPCALVELLRVGFARLRSLALHEVRGTPKVLWRIARRGDAVCPRLVKLRVEGDAELEDVTVFLTATG